jgi:hypothetical protein
MMRATAKRVRVGSVYTFRRNGYDLLLNHASVTDGQVVRVINLPGAPKCNTMGQCHIEDARTGVFLGMVDTRSLVAA